MKRHRALTISRPRRDESGFTLAEALIAMFVFIVGILALANMFLLAISQTNVANCMTAATAEASQTMDMLKARHFATLAVGGALDNNVPGYNASNPVPGVAMVRTRWTITEVSVSPQVYAITVESEPLSAMGGNAGKVRFTTFRANTNL
jgi:Tfp pilus assembly protein PilV